MSREGEEDDDIVCLDASFFVNDNYQLTTFKFGSHVLELLCLHSASTDFDLTGQLVWPGAMILNDYLSKNSEMLQGFSAIELGSGVGVTGILCSKFCREVLMTDHNNEVLKILKKNIELHADCHAELAAEKLEWGNSDQQSSVPLLFDTVEQLLRIRGTQCKFILAYVSRAKRMDSIVVNEAVQHGLLINEVTGTRSIVGNLEGFIFEVTLK
ncbi:protein N-lysine methyltransferase METTL21A isoform X1 [Tripterygium wilfordii]|uniref:Protein N-lysine methyltransferase METTL21A isoform X1 n=1 Tax=Tripterygium wilfordii TaxID=458696 RepID=A0A7J7DZ21_TRIWF|nr:protein N-lysine methyltransferase METTL21A isoform X1 [Tripterygium wilfordii]